MYARDFLYSSTHKVPSQSSIAASLASSKLSQLPANASIVQPIVAMPSEQSVTLRQLRLLIADASPEETKRALIAAVTHYSKLAEAISSELLEFDHIPDDRLLFATTADVTDIAPSIERMSQDMRGEVMVSLTNHNTPLRLWFIELLGSEEPTARSQRFHIPSGSYLYNAAFKSKAP